MVFLLVGVTVPSVSSRIGAHASLFRGFAWLLAVVAVVAGFAVVFTVAWATFALGLLVGLAILAVLFLGKAFAILAIFLMILAVYELLRRRETE